jgi:Aldehyde dehydrogenase family
MGLHDTGVRGTLRRPPGRLDSLRFERFKPGADQGVDARCFDAGSGEIILQFKHRPASSIAALARHLREEEQPKAEKLLPARYLLAVSHSLSRATKAKLARSLERANATEFGLAASVFTADRNRAHRVAQGLTSGTVWTNTWGIVDDVFEEGGFKQSGIGPARGQRADEKFQEIETQIEIVVPLNP